jgi:hypothetical protein
MPEANQRAPQTPAQTTAQWAVRWHGIVLAAALVASVPLFHAIWHGVLGREQPPIHSRGQTPAPALTGSAAKDGSWMLAEEKHLREQSPIVWWLRSGWNELRYRFGVLHSDEVHFGRGDWLFLAPTVAPDREGFEAATANRRRFLGEVRDRVRAAGAELFVMVVPDKARVYPEFAFADGRIPDAKEPIYRMLLADLAALDIATFDLAAAMAAARAAAPDQELYFRRDTHWRPMGALAAGRAAAAAIEAGPLGARLSPRRNLVLAGSESVRLVGDLTAMLGIGTVEAPDQPGRHTVPMSFLAESLAETRDYYGVSLLEDGRLLPMSGKDADAEVLVMGTSFSEENGMKALSLSLGRPVRLTFVYGADGLGPVRKGMEEMASGTRARVVVWELVERGFLEAAWRDPHL